LNSKRKDADNAFGIAVFLPFVTVIFDWCAMAACTKRAGGHVNRLCYEQQRMLFALNDTPISARFYSGYPALDRNSSQDDSLTWRAMPLGNSFR
jgi:hypothetical protein